MRNKNFSGPTLEGTLNFLENNSDFIVSDSNVSFFTDFYRGGYSITSISGEQDNLKVRKLNQKEISKSQKNEMASYMDNVNLAYFHIPKYSPLSNDYDVIYWTDHAKNFLKKRNYTIERMADARADRKMVSEFLNLEKTKTRNFIDSFIGEKIEAQPPFVLCPCPQCVTTKTKTLVVDNILVYQHQRVITPFVYLVNKILQDNLKYKNIHKYFTKCNCGRRFISLKTNTVRCESCR